MSTGTLAAGDLQLRSAVMNELDWGAVLSSSPISDPGAPVSALLTRVRGEFLEMPGLRLTIEQCARLSAIERETCERILGVLVDAGFLCRDAGGRYYRTHRGY